MTVKHLITDPDKFYTNVVQVDTDDLSGDLLYSNRKSYNIVGNLLIVTPEGQKQYTGEHGVSDYEEEFGFILYIKKDS